MSRDRIAWSTLGVGGAVFLALAVWLVPWQLTPGDLSTPPEGHYFTAAQLAAADSFSHVARWWSRLGLVFATVIPAWFGFTRRGRRLLELLPGPGWIRVALMVLSVQAVVLAATAPCAVMLQRAELARGLSHQSWTGFAQDQALGAAVSFTATTLGLWVLLGLIARFGRWWPAAAGAVFAALVVAASWVYPVLVEPLFLHVTPMSDSPLRRQILTLADREGVPASDVGVADASRRTTTLNAYVTGFGSTRQIVVYDNLVRDLPPDQVLVVVAHELGHARDDDVLHGTLIGAGAAIAGAGLLALTLRAQTGAAAVPRALGLIAVMGTLSLPAQNLLSRQVELRADVTSLRFTGDPQAFIAAQVALSTKALQDPNPPGWSQWLFGSHPTPMQRIGLATHWRPPTP